MFVTILYKRTILSIRLFSSSISREILTTRTIRNEIQFSNKSRDKRRKNWWFQKMILRSIVLLVRKELTSKASPVELEFYKTYFSNIVSYNTYECLRAYAKAAFRLHRRNLNFASLPAALCRFRQLRRRGRTCARNLDVSEACTAPRALNYRATFTSRCVIASWEFYDN